MNRTSIYNVQSWVTQLDRLCKENRCESPNFLRPYHFAALALTLWKTNYYNLKVPKQLERYCARMRLWDALGMDAPCYVTEHDPGGRFVPLLALDNKNQVPDAAVQLARIVREYGADEETRGSVEISMQEIIGNCFAHAEVDGALQGVACAQSWPNGKLAQIAIADVGLGVRATLAQNPSLEGRLATENSCALATELGVTSKPLKGHAGYGLALTRQLLERAGGTLLVASHDEWFASNGTRIASGKMPLQWRGTMVVLEWSTLAPLSAKQVYESWPLPEGFENDDIDI